jgi:putative membrane protein
MKNLLTLTALAALAAATSVPAWALDAGKQPDTAGNPATTISTIKQPAVSPEQTGAIPQTRLEPGANSFTEDQARARIQEAGFTNIGKLTLDDQGIWRGPAVKGATALTIGLDYKGDIAASAN